MVTKVQWWTAMTRRQQLEVLVALAVDAAADAEAEPVLAEQLNRMHRTSDSACTTTASTASHGCRLHRSKRGRSRANG